MANREIIGVFKSAGGVMTDIKKIVYIKFGSHLYGTDTPQSDIDFKGVYLPTKRQILLSRFPKTIRSSTGDSHSKNNPGDIDDEIFSLHYFIQLAREGQTVAIDMLHAPDEMILEKTYIWHELVRNRRMFYTRQLKAFLGYCRRQAAKYGIKGSRLNNARDVIRYLESQPDNTKLRDIWASLPTGEHIHFLDPNPKDTNKCKIYQVCGKKFLESVKAKHVLDSLYSFDKAYGHRAELAAKNEGIDWKAVSHALRAAFQLQEIYENGEIIFPLKQAEYLKAVKQGKLDYLTEVSPRLEKEIERVESLAQTSTYPEKVDGNFWDNFLIRILEGK